MFRWTEISLMEVFLESHQKKKKKASDKMLQDECLHLLESFW